MNTQVFRDGAILYNQPKKRTGAEMKALITEKLDFFSRPVPQFTVRGRSTISSACGCSVSIIIIFFGLLYLARIIIVYAIGGDEYRTLENV